MARTVKYTFDPFELVGVEPKKGKTKAAQEIAQYIRESILSDVGEARSPITGQKFTKLNKDYAKHKSGEGGTPIANLELEGKMLDALKVRASRGKITVEISGKQGDKADGHNNHSGQSNLPTRRFIPLEGKDTFRSGIQKGMKDIIRSFDDD